MAGIGEHSEEACSQVDRGITRVFGLLGKRWTGPIVSVLLQRPVHFSELRRAVPGISERMLSDRLSELGTAGLVVREVDEGPPLRVAYRLTGAGAALGPALDALGEWADAHLVDDGPCTQARAARDAVSGAPGPQEHGAGGGGQARPAR